MAATDPFSPAVADLITGPHQVAATLTATTPGYPALTLAVTGGRLAWDDSRSPRVQGSITVALPDDPTALDVLDPRRPVRVAVTITYTLPDGTPDAHQVVNLGLRDRTVRRPDADITLSLASDEALAIDAAPNAAEGYDGGTGSEPDTVTIANGPAFIRTLIENLVYPVAPAFVITAPVAPVEWPYGNPRDYWDAITDIADQLNVDVYDQGDRTFRIAPRRAIASSSVLALTTGPGGTILASESSISRDDWANFVALRYEWTPSTTLGNTRREYGSARVNSGPYNVSLGYRNYAEQRAMPTTRAAANNVAAALLGRMLSRSQGLRVTAVAAWWVRPGHTITVTLPTTAQERHLVAAVEFDLSEMTMTVTTRLPDNVSTIGE